VREGAIEQARYMALGHTDLGGDAVLTEVAVEPQCEDEPLAIAERREPCTEESPVLATLEIHGAGVGREGLVALEWKHLGPIRRWDPARRANRSGAVAEMAPDLAHDHRHRVAHKIASPDAEPVDRLDQPDGSNLDEVVDLLAAARESAGQRSDEGEVLLDHAFPRIHVAVQVVSNEEIAVTT